ncbi:unnamed protein product [Laminaria digitata]
MDVPCRFQQRERTIVFLALGSLGDSLPLCALAARLPSCVSSAHCSRPPSARGDELQHSVEGAAVGCGDVGGKKRRRKEMGVRAGGRPIRAAVEPAAPAAVLGKERRGTVTFERVRCVVVTHRCHCEVLRGLMEDIFDAAEPPRLCPVDVPVLFDPRSNASAKPDVNPDGSPDGNPDGNPERNEGGEEKGVCKELDACLSVLEDLKPEALVFNLYSAFGYHLADALGIPSACASPGVAPR